jgi:hypothetical protein
VLTRLLQRFTYVGRFHNVVAIENALRLVPGNVHGDVSRNSGPNQILDSRAAKIVWAKPRVTARSSIEESEAKRIASPVPVVAIPMRTGIKQKGLSRNEERKIRRVIGSNRHGFID